MSEVQGEFPKICELCGKKIGTRVDLDWHGLGNCAPVCDACHGSGIEDKAAFDRLIESRVSERTQRLREALSNAAVGLRVLRDIGRSPAAKHWGVKLVQVCDERINEIEELLLETGKFIKS